MTLDWETTRRMLAESLGLSEEDLGASKQEEETEDENLELYEESTMSELEIIESEFEEDVFETILEDIEDEEDDEEEDEDEEDDEEDEDEEDEDGDWEQTNDSNLYEEDEDEDEWIENEQSKEDASNPEDFDLTIESPILKRFMTFRKKLTSQRSYGSNIIITEDGIATDFNCNYFRDTSKVKACIVASSENTITGSEFKVRSDLDKTIASAAKAAKEVTFKRRDTSNKDGDAIYSFEIETEAVSFDPYEHRKSWRLETETVKIKDGIKSDFEITDLKEFAKNVRLASQLTSRIYFKNDNEGLWMVAYNGAKSKDVVFQVSLDDMAEMTGTIKDSISVCSDTLKDLVDPTDRKGTLQFAFKKEGLEMFHETPDSELRVHAVMNLNK